MKEKRENILVKLKSIQFLLKKSFKPRKTQRKRRQKQENPDKTITKQDKPRHTTKNEIKEK